MPLITNLPGPLIMQYKGGHGGHILAIIHFEHSSLMLSYRLL